jgi:hypothetical protein
LWKSGTRLLGIVSAVPWLYFFTGAVLIQIRELLLSRRREPEFRDLDIITGQLPTVSRHGGPRKIVLGAAEDPRVSILWRIFWAAGAVVTTTSIICAYIIMAGVSRNTVLIWAGFQLLWLGARILVYHLAEPANPMLQRLCSVRPYEALSVDLRRRVVNLAFALGRSQTAFHPRGQAQYAGDSFSLDALYLVEKTLAPDDGFPLQFPTPRPTSTLVDIISVLGDTSLSAAMWMAGSDVAPMDLYDTCVVVLAVSGLNRTFSVPAARVLSGISPYPTGEKDAENDGPIFVPKGAPHPGTVLTWWYWIPCTSAIWLEIPIAVLSPLLGPHKAALRTDAQVTALLAAGKLNIGLKHVDELKEVVRLSGKGRDSLLELLG